jgi:hypothetical protein
VRLYLAQYQGLPSPVGASVRFLAFAGPSVGAPPAAPTLVLDRMVTLPSFPGGGGFVEIALDDLPAIASGDLYVGFQAPDPAGAIAFPADENGPQKGRGFYSADEGATYAAIAIPDGHGGSTPANFMLRGVFTEPAP